MSLNYNTKMKRMNFRSIICAVVLLMSALIAVAKPNVILIVCDDLNTDIEGFGGHPQSQTPNMTRLMDSGVTFQQMHCTIPICAPSRSSFLTGIYPHTSNNFGMDNWNQNPVLANSRTIFAHFQANGYRTIGTGKMMHHHAHQDWDEYKEDADYGPYAFDGTKQLPHPMTPAPLRNDFGKMKVSLIQNSAISFSVVIDNAYNNLEVLLTSLRSTFRVSWNEDVTLYTIRHASLNDVKSLVQNKEVLLKQESRETVQVVIKD